MSTKHHRKQSRDIKAAVKLVFSWKFFYQTFYHNQIKIENSTGVLYWRSKRVLNWKPEKNVINWNGKILWGSYFYIDILNNLLLIFNDISRKEQIFSRLIFENSIVIVLFNFRIRFLTKVWLVVCLYREYVYCKFNKVSRYMKLILIPKMNLVYTWESM